MLPMGCSCSALTGAKSPAALPVCRMGAKAERDTAPALQAPYPPSLPSAKGARHTGLHATPLSPGWSRRVGVPHSPSVPATDYGRYRGRGGGGTCAKLSAARMICVPLVTQFAYRGEGRRCAGAKLR